jgi:hypothetical protein
MDDVLYYSPFPQAMISLENQENVFPVNDSALWNDFGVF